MKMQVCAVFFAVLLLINIPFLPNGNAQIVTAPSFLTIDLTGQPNTNTFPYGICYDNVQFFYVTIFASGQIVKVNKDTLAYTIHDNDSGTSGFDWYSCVVHNGKVYVNERDDGRTRVYDINGNSFATISIPANIDDAELDYIDGYSVAPNKLRAVDSSNTYDFGCNSFGEIKATNGFVWQVFDCVFDFSATDNTNGVTDYSFHGIIRIDPADNSVTRTAVTGATSLRGLDVDPADSTILWVTDISADKIYKFDTDTLSVTQTIDLPAGSKARGIACNVTDCYVALNKAGNGVDTGKILKVVKADSTTSEIDTTAVIENSKSGVFEVFIASGFLVWSDQSGHVGTINLSTNEKTVSNTLDTNSNHFGVEIDGKIYWAGEGSAKVVITGFPSTGGVDKSSNSRFIELQRPTFANEHLPDGEGIQLVDHGFTWNNKQYGLANNWYTPFEKVDVKVGSVNSAQLKVFSINNIRMMELALVPDIGQRYNAETAITVYFDYKMNIENIEVRQVDKIIEPKYITAEYESAPCTDMEQNKKKHGYANNYEIKCHQLTINNIIFREEPFFENIALTAIDNKNLGQTTYLNEGFDIMGESLNPPKQQLMASSEKGVGLVEMTLVNKFKNIWTDENEILYTQNDAKSWIRLSPTEIPQWCSDRIVKVTTRNYCYFEDMKKFEIERAEQYKNANFPKLLSVPFVGIDSTFAYDMPRKTYTDCNGNPASQKTLDCSIAIIMKNQEKIAQDYLDRVNQR